MTHPTRADVAKHLLRLQAAQASYKGFVQLFHPDRVFPPFQEHLINILNLFEQDKLDERNLLITMPPRMGKSEYCTILFPSYFLARDPARYVMSSSYNSELAVDFGRQIRQHVEDPLLRQAFPDFILSTDSRAADAWRTDANGAYFGTGLGGTTTGRPANLLIVDDPIKSREDADSMLKRNRVWNYYTSALATRLQPTHDGMPPRQIVILTRWHPDDLAGRIQKTEDWREGRWKHINFKAIQTEDTKLRILRSQLPKDHPDYVQYTRTLNPNKRYVFGHREVSLWPERFPLEDLKRRERLNPREFASLYQQQPYIEGGNLLKTEWWQRYPSDLNISSLPIIVIAVDTAFKAKESADYSAAVVAGMDNNGDIYVLDIQRGRWEYPDLKRRLIALNNLWRGRGLRAFYVEDKASGQSIIQDLRKQSGLAVIPYKVVWDKVARVNAITPIIQGGRVHLPDEAPWLDSFVEEAVSFPNGAHDDQVDALTMALDVLSKTGLAHDWEQLTSVSHAPLAPDSYKGKSLMELVRHNAQPFKGYGAI